MLEKMTREAMLLKKKEAPKIPTVKDMRLTYGNKPYSVPILSEPPKSVVSKLISTFATMPTLVLAVDIETHGWPEGKDFKDLVGAFGFYTTRDKEQLDFSRVVQIGWIVGTTDLGDEPWISKEYLVKPDGFEVSKKATDFHKIHHSQAVNEGLPLRDVLAEFMRDAADVAEQGGRVVAHQLEFDGGIIRRELERCRMFDLEKRWFAMATKGFCTMDPWACTWVRRCFGLPVRGTESEKSLMSVRDLLELLVPGHKDLLARAHTANADAEMCRLVYIPYCNLVTMAEGSL